MTSGKLEISRFFEALDWEPLREDKDGNPIGYCFDPYGYHKHGDTTGKLIFYPETERASCFVCGSLTLSKLVSAVKGISESEAISWIAQFRVGIEASDEAFKARIAEKLDYKWTPRESFLPRFVDGVIERYEPLWESENEDACSWMRNRGISEQTAKEFNLRFSNGIRRLPPKGINEEPYVGPAILLPHYWKGQLVGWQSRWLGKKLPKWLQKYVNTRDFPRDHTLYGYDLVNYELPTVVVESGTTVLWLRECGISAVATFGSKVTDKQLKVLRGFQNGLVFAPDNDDASIYWMMRLSALDQYVPTQTLKRIQVKHQNDGSDLGSLAPDFDATWKAVTNFHKN